MVANTITILRSLLSFVAIAMLFYTSDKVYVAAFVLTIIVIWMDGLDGFFARLLNESSKFGAVLDILGDRIVENVYWISFLALGWIPLWIPLVIVSRGIITDGLRSIALEQGYTAFGSSTMMQSKIGKFIVASNFCRFSYAVFKAIAFAFLILANMQGEYQGKEIVNIIAYSSAYIAVFFCVVRGIPVIIESKRFFPSK
ncbi:MAG: CDP-alcohol phosphatidyltransferase family protein [Candidatus Gastranaerophilales bacterium]|nr:CDP-alcohol phosphatidyltransferase family protein [Candidatus Gastranaerophilales bacterium]